MTENIKKISIWLDEKYPSSYGSPIFETKNIIISMFQLLEQQQHLEVAFVKELEIKDELRKSKIANKILEQKLEASQRIRERIAKAGGVDICPCCDGQGGFETSPESGEECSDCQGSGLIKINQ